MVDTWYDGGWEGSGGAPIGGMVVGLRGAKGERSVREAAMAACGTSSGRGIFARFSAVEGGVMDRVSYDGGGRGDEEVPPGGGVGGGRGARRERCSRGSAMAEILRELVFGGKRRGT